MMRLCNIYEQAHAMELIVISAMRMPRNNQNYARGRGYRPRSFVTKGDRTGVVCHPHHFFK